MSRPRSADCTVIGPEPGGCPVATRRSGSNASRLRRYVVKSCSGTGATSICSSTPSSAPNSVSERAADRLPPGVVGDDGPDLGQPFLLGVLGDRPGHHRRRRQAGAERVPAVLGEDRLRAGLDEEQRHLQLLGHARRRQADVAGDDPADGDHAFLDEPFDRRRPCLGVRLVVDDRQLDRAAGDPAGGVELVDGELHAVADLHAPRRERSGQRRQHADDDRLTGRRRRVPTSPRQTSRWR